VVGCGPKGRPEGAGGANGGGPAPVGQPGGAVAGDPAGSPSPGGTDAGSTGSDSLGADSPGQNDPAGSPGTATGSAAAIGSAGQAARFDPEHPPRAIWIVRSDLTDQRRLATAIDWAADTGFTDLFLQVRGRGDAYYRSAIVPRAEPLGGGDWDPLGEALPAARARGLRVHAWVNVGIAWSGETRPRVPEHVARQHRDWFVWIANRGRPPRNMLEIPSKELLRRDIEGYFLNAAHPEVGPHLEAVVRELVATYDLDGIHFDYVRFPRRVRSLDPLSRTSFGAAGGVDPLTLVDPKSARTRYGAAEAERLSALWQAWSEEQVTGVVARLAGVAREVRPGIMVSAAVYPDPATARAELSQAWDLWLSERVIDVAVPMCYAADKKIARADLAVARGATGGRLWAGLGVYNKPVGEAMAGAELARELGYEGVSIFSYGAAREAGPKASSVIAAALAGFARP